MSFLQQQDNSAIEVREETLVYVIGIIRDDKITSPCKIGISATPARRVAALQTASYEELRIAHVFRLPSRKIASDVEECFHSAQSAHRIRGEWFNLDPGNAIALLKLQIRMMLDLLTGLEDWEKNIVVSSIDGDYGA